jgi:hypothetical protein
MTKIRRQVWGKTIYLVWFEYLKELESGNSKEPWFSKYKDWDLHEAGCLQDIKEPTNEVGSFRV